MSAHALDGLGVEGLLDLAGPRVRPRALSKATLVDLSHVIEDMVGAHATGGVVITGFQYARNWLSEVDRYERLARTDGRRVAIFTRDQVPEPTAVRPYRIRVGSRLAEEWFVLVRTSAFSVALFGRDLESSSDDIASELDRLFDSAWSFDAHLVDEMARFVLGHAAAQGDDVSGLVADLDALPLTQISETLIREFYSAVFDRLDRDKRRLRASRERERRTATALRESNARMLHLERLSTLGSTAASFAHEVNNPLQIIVAEAEAISWELDAFAEAQPDPAGLVRELKVTVEASARLVSESAESIGRMTQGVLDIVRQGRLQLEQTELGEWLRDSADRLARGSGVRLAISAPEVSCAAMIDRDRLSHVLTNLLDNARHACADDCAEEREPLIRIDLLADGDRLHLRVADSGSGIPEAVLDRVFDPFVSSRIGEGGTGLGLPLSRRFVEDLQGRLELLSTGPEGTVFEIELPRMSSGGAAPGPEAVGSSEAGGEGNRSRVLVLDDDVHVRRTLCRMLKRAGYQVFAAATIEEAEQLAIGQAIDVGVVDFDLRAERSGVEVIEALVARNLLVPGRSLMISGNLRSTLPEHPDIPVLTKPFRLEALLEALAALRP